MRRNSTYRFLINTDRDNLEVHDLDNESGSCQIDEIIMSGNAKYLSIENTIDKLKLWLSKNSQYDGCGHCLSKLNVK